MSPSYEDGLALLSSSIVQIGNSKMRARFGYAGAGEVLSPWFSGVVVDPEFTIGTEISISLQAHATVPVTLLRQQATRQWVNVSRHDIVRLLIKGSGFEATLSDVVVPEAMEDLSKVLWDQEKISYEQGSHTDLWCIEDLISQSLL